jgi:hypothetical protein
MSEKKRGGDASIKPLAEVDARKPANQGEAPTETPEQADPKVDLGALGAQLKQLYSSWLDEPVPDRFTKLLDELERDERGKS